MHPGAELQYPLARAAATLRRRHASTGDARGQKRLARTIARINPEAVSRQCGAALMLKAVLP